ncbi:MAG: TIGR02281 family clan AA aspartic protease [Alphaproteobacteria bacterium]
MPRNPFVLVAIGIAALLALVVTLNSLFPGSLTPVGTWPAVLAKLILLVFVSGSFALSRDVSLGQGLRYGAIWVAITLALVLGYTLRDDVRAVGQRLLAALAPSAAREVAPGAVALTRTANGHFMARARVKGPDLSETTVMFLVDTGASRVSLTAEDARRLGIDPDDLRFDRMVRTANGTNSVASVSLPRISIGSVSVDAVPSHVVASGLDVSLLGMSFLNDLSAFEFEGDRLTLRK